MGRKQAKGLTEAEIIEVGAELFSKRGVSITMQEIACSANVSRQMVYKYFGSRGGLLVALARRFDQKLGIEEQLMAATTQRRNDDKIEQFTRAWLNYLEDIAEISSDLIRQQLTDTAARSAYRDRLADARIWFAALVKALNKCDGRKRKVEETAELILGILSPQTYGLLRSDMQWPHEKIVSHLSSVTLSSLN